MSLTGRLTAFFLTALAVVLLGFSMSLFVLARNYLYHQLDARLDVALDTLIAAVEFKAGGVEWEPNERRLALGQGRGPEEIRWFIRDDKGHLVDRSPNLDDDLAESIGAGLNPDQFSDLMDPRGQSWRLLQRSVRSDDRPAPPAPAANQAAGERLFPWLGMTAAVSPAGVKATLGSLAWALGGLSAGLWLLAALLGRRLCRSALVPVANMAATARAMSAANLDQRLPNPGTGDELENLSRAFNDLLTRLHESFERQQRFTGDASHQLRTPLTAMLGQIEVSLRRERSALEYRQVLSLVHGQAQQLRHIVEMLLFLARADREARLPNLEAVDLVAWLEEYQQRWLEHPRAADLRAGPWPEGPVCVMAQAPLLGQLLDSLLDNACKYSEPGSPIALRLERSRGRVKLSVEDAGPGIAAADLPHIFEPFYRCAGARKRGAGGIGLGLAVVQRIAAAFGGSVSAASAPGSGARLTLELTEIKVAEPAASAVATN